MRISISHRKTVMERIIIEADSIPDAKRKQKDGAYDHLWIDKAVSEIDEFYDYERDDGFINGEIYES